MQSKKLAGITKIVSVLTIVTIISKVFGMLREMGIASTFGIGLETDSFYLALTIPSLLFVSIGTAIQNIFIIEFTKVKEKDNSIDKQNYITSNLSNIISVVSIIIFIIAFALTPFLIKIIAPGFKDIEKFNLTVKITRILLPIIVILPLYQIKASVLKVYNKFITVAVIDLFFNLFQIGYLLFFPNVSIIGLAYSVTISYLVQLLIINIIVYKIGLRFKKILNFQDKSFLIILKLFIPTVISFLVIQVTAIIDKSFSSKLGDGAISALNYGLMIRTVVYSILIASIVTVFYPQILKQKNDGDIITYNKTINNTISFIWLIILPITILLFVFSKEVVAILLERGQFTHENTILTAKVLGCYLIGMPFYALNEILTYISYANKNSKTPLLVTTISSIINIFLIIILKDSLDVLGIALSLSISQIVSFLLILILNNKYVKFSNMKDVLKITIINIILLIILLLVEPYLYHSSKILMSILLVGGYSLIVLVIYYFLCKMLKISFLNEFGIFIKGRGKI